MRHKPLTAWAKKPPDPKVVEKLARLLFKSEEEELQEFLNKPGIIERILKS
jgi:hypothetical protein